ncbi:MAG: sterol desaturase family protein [Pseudolabrys sp.]|nr:sterol desaturase family protein [Pseudolabrys sp.]MSP31970.1 sterol desaturase family protein [Pseudolabrys sp.]
MSPSLEIAVRIGGAALVFAAMALWEWLAPRRALTFGRRPRWPGNLGILAVDIVAVRLLVPTAAVGVALIASERGWGLLNLFGLPAWGAILIGVIALDLVIYIQHVAFHYVPVLWRLHRMHHADLDIDVTTGVRFHPLEILLSLAIKMAAVLALGVPAVAVLIFEVLLNATSVFNHSNVALPAWLEPMVRWIVVTPQMHQVHHSIERVETNSNFGFNMPWWDRLFGTYRARPAAGEQYVVIGLPIFRDIAESTIVHLLTQPFRDDGNRQL